MASFGGRRIFVPERADAPRVYEDGSPAYAMRDAGWAASNDAFQSDMDLADHQVALVEYDTASGSHSIRTAMSPCPSGAGTWPAPEGTLIADLVRNRLMVRRALNRAKPERIDYGGLTADAHNGADQAMAVDLLAALEGRAPFPVTPWDSMVAGLTVMAPLEKS